MNLDEDSAADAFFDDLISAVEQQLESKDTAFVRKVYEKLLDGGMTESEAKEAMAACLAEESDKMFRSQKPFDTDSYRRSLESISPEP